MNWGIKIIRTNNLFKLLTFLISFIILCGCASNTKTANAPGNWWTNEVIVGNTPISIGRVKAGDQIRIWSSKGYILLEEDWKDSIVADSNDKIVNFFNYDGYHEVKVVKYKNNTIVRYKIIEN